MEELNEKLEALKAAYSANPYPTLHERKEVLLKLKQALIRNEDAIYEALKADYSYRSEFDTLVADLLPCVMTINYTLGRLKRWMKPSRRHAGMLLAPSTVAVHYQPLGVVGVIVPWNFPLYLSLGPAIQALAAGNRVMMKMSEYTPKINQAIAKVTEEISDHLCVMEGGSRTGAAFSSLPFDHLIFTGSTVVGRHVAKAAAENLTPITLEMGGKSPTIIAPDANMEAAVDAIIMGKMMNSGQICVAPDYVFVPGDRQQEFMQRFRERFAEYYVNDHNKNKQTCIIDDRQFSRLQSFIKDAEARGAKIDIVQADSTGEGFLPMHIVTNVSDDMAIMQEEIFGTLLPVLSYQSIEEAIKYINARPRPLALYIMSSDKQTVDNVLKNTHSGGVCVNDTTMHVVADDAPFGGIGNSGMGHYHGFEGFCTFSHAKTVETSKPWIPKNRYFLKHRDIMFTAMRKAFLR